jgi:hypothetical protein
MKKATVKLHNKIKSKTFIQNMGRKAIYLDGAIESGIRDFKLWLLWNSLDLKKVRARPLYKGRLDKDDFNAEIQKQLKENPKLNYYITGEHDFNTK